MIVPRKTLLLPLIVLSSFISSCKKDNPTDQGSTKITTPVKTPLTAPSNLVLISMSAAEVKLKWTDNSSNETAFLVEQSIDSVTFTTAATVAANVDSVSISGTYLTMNTYFFRVRAKNTDTTSGTTNLVRLTLLPPPSNFKVVQFTSSSVSFRWTDNSSTETAFVIEQSVNGSAYAPIDSTGPDVVSRVTSGSFDSSKTYSFRLSARTGSNRSAYSNAVARTLGNWIFVTGGTFQMGRSDGTQDERPVHSVTLSNFYIAKYEVTVAEYRKYTTATGKPFPAMPAGGWNDSNPIVNVTWFDADAYCQWLDSTSDKSIRLPTEAEWEYAARGGANSQHCAYAGSNAIDDVAWYYLNSSSITYPVGLKLPNELGIYDMSGNAWEWVYDWQGSYSYLPQTDPKGPTLGGNYKVFRGGSWFNYGLAEGECRVDTRYYYSPDRKVTDGGFRIVKSAK